MTREEVISNTPYCMTRAPINLVIPMVQISKHQMKFVLYVILDQHTLLPVQQLPTYILFITLCVAAIYLILSLMKMLFCNTQAVKFTKKVISHAMARDGSSGGVVQIAVINKEGVSREVVPGNMLPYGP